MKRTTFIGFFLLLIGLSVASGQGFIKLAQLQKSINEPGKIKVINFWATWCAPCVKELPFFEKVNSTNKNVQVLLVSMDYDLDPNPEKVKKFIARKKIESAVVILEEENPGDWIDKIDKEWSGALPSTLIVNPVTKKRKFIQGELKEGDLEKLIDEISK
ncbi:MAG: TlpA family protein disulfide reductase [Bacteroidetes bacterium]|nr:TlpA family protein disulfide reductase [Bacteroidota bacterium]